jgi:hypothetical protein
MKIQWLLWAISGCALLYASYIALGGRALLKLQEKPDRILGKMVRFSEIDWMNRTSLPPAKVISFDGESYWAELTEPVTVHDETFAMRQLRARHNGHLISSAKKYGVLAVGGQTPKGQGFVACLNLS